MYLHVILIENILKNILFIGSLTLADYANSAEKKVATPILEIISASGVRSPPKQYHVIIVIVLKLLFKERIKIIRLSYSFVLLLLY